MDEFEYEIRRSTRARHARVEVAYGGVTVVLPQRAPERVARRLVRDQYDWIVRALVKVERDRSAVAERTLTDGAQIPLLGQELELRVAVIGEAERESVSFRARDGRVTVRAHSEAPQDLAVPLERWYRRVARKEATARLDAITRRNGTRYSKLTIRDQSTRWGSCAANGAISINWRLLLAPEAVFHYVIEHEAAHLEVHDHSQRFWNLLDERMPDWQEHRDWLRHSGGTLRLH
ncbi:MAG: M48 family metallopeptidase [Thermoleophilaceae bacterium]|nr:M48 family metallopeptidase [Thermoleophilaceae bacterium]